MRSHLIFILLFSVIALVFYDSMLDKQPLNFHTWRQADCLSLTYFYSQGAPFLEPEMHALLADEKTSGKSAGEFPILYFAVGKLWQVAGQSYLSYRLFGLAILFSGLFCLYKAIHLLIGDTFWSIVSTLMVFFCPVFAAYGVSFLTDVPALCMTFIGLYFLTRHHLNSSYRSLWISAAFFAFAGLLKVSSLIVFVFLGLILLVETLGLKSLHNRFLFLSRKQAWLAFTFVPFVLIVWYAYAAHYNSTHGFKYTFNSIHPVWLLSSEQFGDMLSKAIQFPSRIFSSRTMLFVAIGLFLYNLTQWYRMALLQNLSNLVIPIGGVVYFLLWAPLMGHHDYYYVALVVLFPAIFLPFIAQLKVDRFALYRSALFRAGTLLILLYSAVYARDVMKLKIANRFETFTFSEGSLFHGFMHWTNHETTSKYNNWKSIREKMDELGIAKEERIIVLNDMTINASLFYMNMRGWTDFQEYRTPEEFDELIGKGARFLLVDEVQLTEPYLKPYTSNPILAYNGMQLFRIGP